MTEIAEISARLTALETVVKQLIVHMAVRDEDPPRWVQTRRNLAMSAIHAYGPAPLGHTALIRNAMAGLFDQAELVAADYRARGPRGTPRAFAR